MKYALIFFTFLLSTNTYSSTFTIGSRASFMSADDKLANGLNYIEFKRNNEKYFDDFILKTSLELRAFDPYTSNEEAFIDPVNVSAEFLFNTTSFQVGFLRYRFSETFGLQILDVANPRDYSEYFLNDLSWAKRSIFGLNMLNKIGNLEALWMMTLWGNGDRLPYKNSPYDTVEGQLGYQGGVVDRAWFKDIEYGVRLKYLFENGLDLSVIGYRHHNRPSIVTLNQKSAYEYVLRPYNEMVESLGLAGSYVVEDWVFRTDALITFDDSLIRPDFSIERKDHKQFLLGLDRVWESWTIGGQYQNDLTLKRQFYGMKFEYDKYEKWKPSAMLFVSDKNQDQWFQFKNSFILNELNFSLTWDSIHGAFNAKSLFGQHRRDDRFLMDLAFVY